MTLAGQYAYAGREWVVERVRPIIGAKILDTVHNHHNYAWRERHGERDLWVVRKGATPAFPGQRGFVGGSMGDDAVILEGVESEASAASLYSTVHGAGRVMSRTDAKGKRNRKTGEVHRARAGSARKRCRRGCGRRACISSAATSTRRRRPTAASPTCSRITRARSRSSTGCVRSSC